MALECVLGELGAGIGSGDVDRQRGAADLVGGGRQRFTGRWDVSGDDVGAVAREYLGNGGADTAGGTGDHGNLAGQWLVPAGRGDRIFLVDADDLGVHERRLSRQQESQGRLQSAQTGLGIGGDVDELGGCAVAQFLAERTGEALERALCHMLARVLDELRSGADDHEPRTVARRPDGGREELEQLRQLRRLGDAGGIEHRGAQLVCSTTTRVVHDQLIVVGQQFAQRLDQPAVAADQDGPGQWGLAGLVAAQRGRLWQADLARDECARS